MFQQETSSNLQQSVADNFNVTAGDNFYNNGVIVSGDARDFRNFFIENVNNLPILPMELLQQMQSQSSSENRHYPI